MFPNTTSLVCRDLIRFILLERRRLHVRDEFYPVENPPIYGEDEKKCSFLIEGGFQNHALSNGVYCFILSPNSLDLCVAAITASIKILRNPPSSSL